AAAAAAFGVQRPSTMRGKLERDDDPPAPARPRTPDPRARGVRARKVTHRRRVGHPEDPVDDATERIEDLRLDVVEIADETGVDGHARRSSRAWCPLCD